MRICHFLMAEDGTKGPFGFQWLLGGAAFFKRARHEAPIGTRDLRLIR